MLGAIRHRLADTARRVLTRLILSDEKLSEATFDAKITFLLNEVSEMRSLVRASTANSRLPPAIAQTNASFSYQWDQLVQGSHLIGDAAFERDMFDRVKQYTGGLGPEWFRGKTVLDAGCGNGRWSYAFAKMGARVTAIDQSESAIAAVRRTLSDSGLDVDARPADILRTDLSGNRFDFVWCFGVVHHTGDTHRAIRNVASAVQPGGRLYLMVYGEPVETGDFVGVNTYVQLRRETAFMSFDEKVLYLKSRFPAEQVHGWFDAISPTINDLHRFEELKAWLLDLGFSNICRTVATQHNHIIAERNLDAGSVAPR